MRDLHNNIIWRGISPAAAVTDNTPFVSQIVDLQGYDAAEFVILTGSLADADATFTTLLEHGDAANLSDAAAGPDDRCWGRRRWRASPSATTTRCSRSATRAQAVRPRDDHAGGQQRQRLRRWRLGAGPPAQPAGAEPAGLMERAASGSPLLLLNG